ncbi:MAG: hypothetical protein JXB04_13505 [Kiritimatiellae bacterium]|nr:hypothetical protein [Kiritimatiellia bacterium]
MNLVHTSLAVVGVLALIESVWGLAAPNSIKQIAGWYTRLAGEKQPVMGALLVALALLFAAFILVDQPLSSWVLLAVAVAFAGFGLLCFRANALRGLLSAWILNRTVLVIRAIYATELLVAVALLWVALARK